jgi:exosortase
MSNGTSIVAVRFPSSSIDWVKATLGVVLVGFIYYAYFVQTVEIQHVTTMGCYIWLVSHWNHVSNYSHGPLIPMIAIGLLWWNLSNRDSDRNWKPFWIALGATVFILMTPDLFSDSLTQGVIRLAPFLLFWQVAALWGAIRETMDDPDARGLFVVGLAMVLYYFGVKAMQPRLVVFSFVILLYGLALALGGRGAFRLLLFPISFLLLMIPLNFLDEKVGFPLQLLMARSSTELLNMIGIETTRIGTGIYSRVFHFDVAAPCSGIRSLMALTTVTAAYAYVTQNVQWKRWVLFLSAMPLAVLGNVARVTSIALVAQVYGQEIASRTYHEYSGFIVFAVALSSMVIIGLLLNFPFRRYFENWLKPPPPPPTDGGLQAEQPLL